MSLSGDTIDVPFEVTPYGFKYGGAEVQRVASDPKRGWVVLVIKSLKGSVQVYVTKTGKIRVFRNGKVERDGR